MPKCGFYSFCFSNMEVNGYCLVINIFQIIFFCVVQQKKETHTGLEQRENE